jgi:hypothetical protein
MYKQSDMDRLIAGTNTQGKSTGDASLDGDMPKLEILLEQVRLGKIHVLCICETKLSNKHLEALTSLIKHNKLAHRMTYTDHRSTRGVLIVWNDVGFPFQVKRTWIDGEDKRAVRIE